MGGNASMTGRTLEEDMESPVASELSRLLFEEVGNRHELSDVADATAAAANVCCGSSCAATLEVDESLSSMENVKSTDPFRFRNGFLPAGEDAALEGEGRML